MDKNTCIIALSFGDSHFSHHGASNSALANQVLVAMQNYHIPAIAQWEIAGLATDRGLPRGCVCTSIPLPKDKEYIDTYEVLVEAKRIMKEKGYTNAMFIAHPDHLPRVLLVAKKLGIVDCATYPVPTIPIPYDPKSTQWWTRNKMFWMIRESFVLRWYRLKGLI